MNLITNFAKHDQHIWTARCFLPVSASAVGALARNAAVGAWWARKQDFSRNRSHTVAILTKNPSSENWILGSFWKGQQSKLLVFSQVQNSSCSSCMGALYWTFANASMSLNLEIILVLVRNLRIEDGFAWWGYDVFLFFKNLKGWLVSAFVGRPPVMAAGIRIGFRVRDHHRGLNNTSLLQFEAKLEKSESESGIFLQMAVNLIHTLPITTSP